MQYWKRFHQYSYVVCTWLDERLLRPLAALHSLWFMSQFFDTSPPEHALGLDCRSLGRCSRGGGGWGVGGGKEETEPRFLLVCFRKATSRSLMKQCLARHKAVELLTLLAHDQRCGASFSLSFLFFCTLSPCPSSSPSCTSLIWNPSRNSGRRGRSHQLLMYSQCRERREGRLSKVSNTPVKFFGLVFSPLSLKERLN